MDKYITIGVAGHTGHGKTSIIRTLTNLEANKKKTRAKQISAESVITPYKSTLSSKVQITFIEVPGRIDFIKNIIRGLTAIDIAILVVAADDGITRQTMEHIYALKYLGIKDGFIVLSKGDLLDDDLLELAEMEIIEAVKGTFLQEKPIIVFSLTKKKGANALKIAVEQETKNVFPKDIDSPFRMWIDNVRGFPGVGTVICGTILSGRIVPDDPLLLLPDIRETRVRSLEVHNQKVTKAWAGQRVGINLPKISLKEVRRGMLILAPQSQSIMNRFVNVHLDAVKPIKNYQRVRIHIGTSLSNVLVVLMEKEKLDTGDSDFAQLRFSNPLPVFPKDSFIISSLNSNLVIGGGIVLEKSKNKFRKIKRPVVIPYLCALQNENYRETIIQFFNKNNNKLITSQEIAEYSGLPLLKIDKEIKNIVQGGEILEFEKKRFIKKNNYLKLMDKTEAVATKIISKNQFKPRVNQEEIKYKIAEVLEDALLQNILLELCNKKKLFKEKQGGFSLPGMVSLLSEDKEKLAVRLLTYSEKIGFSTFSAGGFCQITEEKILKNDIDAILDYLYHQGKLIRLNDNNFIAAKAMEIIKERVKNAIIEKGSITLTDCKDILGYGRARAVPVLEYLDGLGFTYRQGNKRRLKRSSLHRLE